MPESTGGARRTAADVNALWKKFTESHVGRGGDPDYEEFASQYRVGPKALQKLKNQHQQGKDPTTWSRINQDKWSSRRTAGQFDYVDKLYPKDMLNEQRERFPHLQGVDDHTLAMFNHDVNLATGAPHPIRDHSVGNPTSFKWFTDRDQSKWDNPKAWMEKNGPSQRQAGQNVTQMWEKFQADPSATLRGDESDYEQFGQRFQVGPRAINKLKQQHGVGTTAAKAALRRRQAGEMGAGSPADNNLTQPIRPPLINEITGQPANGQDTEMIRIPTGDWSTASRQAQARYRRWCARHHLKAASAKNFYWYLGQINRREARLLTADDKIQDPYTDINRHDYRKDEDQIFYPQRGYEEWGPQSRPSGRPYVRDQLGPGKHRKQKVEAGLRRQAWGDDDWAPGGTSDDFNSPAAGYEYHDPYQQNGWKMTHSTDDGFTRWVHPHGHSIEGYEGPNGGSYQLFDHKGGSAGNVVDDPLHLMGIVNKAVQRKQYAMRRGAPFAGYDDFDDCTSENSDKRDPKAYCGEIKHRTEDKKTSSRKQAWSGWGPAVFPKTRQVTGWNWDDHLNGYVSNHPQRFACECGDSFPTPGGFQRCACGKQWNSYVIGSGGPSREAAAEKFLVREIPVRPDVIVANRQLVATSKARSTKLVDPRTGTIHTLIDPGQLEDGEDAGTPTMKPNPKDWANRMPPKGNPGQFSANPIGNGKRKGKARA